MKRLHRASRGFTILELVIASMTFSTILLICTAGVLYIGKLYYKSITQARTQETARTLVEEISRPLQFNGGTPIASPTQVKSGATVGSLCVNYTRFSYALDQELSDVSDTANHKIKHVLWRDSLTNKNSCPPLDLTPNVPSDINTSAAGPAQELMAPSTRILVLNASQVGGPTSPLWKVRIRLIYGDNDLLQSTAIPADKRSCVGGSGGQFCGVSDLSTIVTKRIQ